MVFSSCFRSIIESNDRRGSFWVLKRRTYQTLAWLRWDEEAETNITLEAVPSLSSIELHILHLQPSFSCHARRDVGGLKQPCRSESDWLGSQASRSRIEQQSDGKPAQCPVKYISYIVFSRVEFYAPRGAHSRRTDSPTTRFPGRGYNQNLWTCSLVYPNSFKMPPRLPCVQPKPPFAPAIASIMAGGPLTKTLSALVVEAFSTKSLVT